MALTFIILLFGLPLLAWISPVAVVMVMIFIPGVFLLVAVLPYWSRLRRWTRAQGVMRGANAAVVGLLGAALYQPVWTNAIFGPVNLSWCWWVFSYSVSGSCLLGPS